MALSSISSSGNTQTQYPVLVNGYLCYSAAQVTEARNFINPHPAAKIKSAPTANTVFASSGGYSSYTASGSAKVSALRSRGSRFNIFA